VVREYEKALLKAERKELLYNYSLIMFEAADFKKCHGYLREFESSLVAGRDDNDLAMVRLFRDFVEWRCNRNIEKGVVDTYEKLQEKVTDRNVRGVINNNLLFYRQGSLTENTHEILRMMDETLETEYKMTKKQRGLIHLNKLSVLLRKGRLPEAQKLLKEIENREEAIKDTDFLKNKYYLLKKTKDEGLEAFVDEVKAINANLGFCLRADLEKERENETALIGDLKATKGINPVIKNYIFSLLIKHSSLFEQYSDYLAEMAELTTDSNILSILLNLYENKADLEKQRFILLRLLKLQPKLASVKVKLAKIYLAEHKTAEAEEVLRGIEGPEELGDIAYLQFIEKNIHVSIKKEEEVKDEIKKEDTHKKRIKKRKRVRLPKGVEKAQENYKGDPERWLPKWQRKGYKKKGKKGGAGKTQGLATVGKE
jgi:signal recognition particle subunit SRP72